ncbi:inorganic phosphate transporter, partial [Craterilacuibacter sp.]|uniref:inorganic phosphate transporter n=1 Tax=Craterilacuibacter sp. TaxID=2870909 RepID=UPI003F3838A3
MDLQDLNDLNKAADKGRSDFMRLGLALLFIVGAVIYSTTLGHVSLPMMVAAGIGAYMAMNIGANDVANNVGPAVGSKALTMGGALIIAAVFEAGGAIIAGGDVVSTIRSGIIDPSLIPDKAAFIWIMMSALLAAALWLNIATLVGAPVSTTHSIVGALLGSGVMAAGFGIANWSKVATIAASWVISPVLGGVIAAAFLYFIKRTITYQSDMKAAAARIVPILIALMAWIFTSYLLIKGLARIWPMSFSSAMAGGVGIGLLTYFVLRPVVARRARA